MADGFLFPFGIKDDGQIDNVQPHILKNRLPIFHPGKVHRCPGFLVEHGQIGIARSNMANHLHIFAIHVFPGHVFHEWQLESFWNILGFFMQSFQLRVCRISVPENLGFLFIEIMGLVGIRISSPESQVIPIVPFDHVPRMPGSTDRPVGCEIACHRNPQAAHHGNGDIGIIIAHSARQPHPCPETVHRNNGRFYKMRMQPSF